MTTPPPPDEKLKQNGAAEERSKALGDLCASFGISRERVQSWHDKKTDVRDILDLRIVCEVCTVSEVASSLNLAQSAAAQLKKHFESKVWDNDCPLTFEQLMDKYQTSHIPMACPLCSRPTVQHERTVELTQPKLIVLSAESTSDEVMAWLKQEGLFSRFGAELSSRTGRQLVGYSLATFQKVFGAFDGEDLYQAIQHSLRLGEEGGVVSPVVDGAVEQEEHAELESGQEKCRCTRCRLKRKLQDRRRREEELEMLRQEEVKTILAPVMAQRVHAIEQCDVKSDSAQSEAVTAAAATTADPESQSPAPKGGSEFERVLEEEFGGLDLMAEIEKMKTEFGTTDGSSSFQCLQRHTHAGSTQAIPVNHSFVVTQNQVDVTDSQANKKAKKKRRRRKKKRR